MTDDQFEISDDQAWAHFQRTGCILPGFQGVIAERRSLVQAWADAPEPDVGQHRGSTPAAPP